MSRVLLSTAFAALLAGSAVAQSGSYDAAKLADALIDTSWRSIEVSIPTMVSMMTVELERAGVSGTAASVYGDQIRAALTRESFTRLLANAFAENFSQQELVELRSFVGSPLGAKYLKLSADVTAGTKFFMPVIRQACDSAMEKLGQQDRRSLDKLCGKL